MSRARLLFTAMLLLLAAGPAVPQALRSIKPIERAPAKAGAERLQPQALPDRLAPFAAPLAVSAERVENAMQQLVRAWNRRELEALLVPEFRDRTRLLDVLRTRVPRRVTLELVSVQRWEIIEQAVVGGTMLTRVNVTARTRLQNAGTRGELGPREGENDYVLTLLDATK